jgi:hypothetical protein
MDLLRRNIKSAFEINWDIDHLLDFLISHVQLENDIPYTCGGQRGWR